MDGRLLPTRRRSLRAGLAVGLVMVAGCGSDPVTREDFVEQLVAITSGPNRATPELAGCIYDRIAEDRSLLEDAASGADFPPETERQLVRVTADCTTDVEEAEAERRSARTTSTTAPERSTTPGRGTARTTTTGVRNR